MNECANGNKTTPGWNDGRQAPKWCLMSGVRFCLPSENESAESLNNDNDEICRNGKEIERVVLT